MLFIQMSVLFHSDQKSIFLKFLQKCLKYTKIKNPVIPVQKRKRKSKTRLRMKDMMNLMISQMKIPKMFPARLPTLFLALVIWEFVAGF